MANYRERWKREEIAPISCNGVKLKFNEPRDSRGALSCHRDLAASKRIRLDMRVPLITLARVSRSFAAPRDVSMTWSIRTCLARRSCCEIVTYSILIKLHCRLLWFSEGTGHRQQTEDVGELDLQHFPGWPILGWSGRLRGFRPRWQRQSRRPRSFG